MKLSDKVDLQSLMDATCDDQDMAIELLHLYFDLTRQEMTRLKEALNQGDAVTVSAVAHKCAGSSAACGMAELARLLSVLEQEAKKKMPDNVQDQWAKIQEELEESRRTVKNYFDCDF